MTEQKLREQDAEIETRRNWERKLKEKKENQGGMTKVVHETTV